MNCDHNQCRSFQLLGCSLRKMLFGLVNLTALVQQTETDDPRQSFGELLTKHTLAQMLAKENS